MSNIHHPIPTVKPEVNYRASSVWQFNQKATEQYLDTVYYAVQGESKCLVCR